MTSIIPAAINTDIWEKLPDETAKAYSAFVVYMRLDPDIRSIPKAIKEKYGSVTSSKLRLWYRWSSEHSWMIRANSWDAEVYRLKNAKHVKDVMEMEDRHIKIAQALQQAAVKRLRTLDENELTVTDILRFFLEGAKMERLTLGQPNEISKNVNANLSIEAFDYSAMSDEELRKILATNAKQSSQVIDA